MCALLAEEMKYRQEIKEVNAKKEERKRVLKSLSQRIDDLCRKSEGVEKLYGDFHHTDVKVLRETLEEEMVKGLKKDIQIKILEDEYNELMEMKRDQQRKLQRWSSHQELMEQTLKLTHFEDIRCLRSHIENNIRVTDELLQKDNYIKEQISQLKNGLKEFKKQKEGLDVEQSRKLSQIQKERDSTATEAKKWTAQWNTIEGSAAAKTLLLGKIKMTFFNLYDMIYEIVRGYSVDMSDTDSQLDYVKTFIKDYNELLALYEEIISRVKQEHTGLDAKKLAIKKALNRTMQERDRTGEELTKALKNELKKEFEEALYQEQEKLRKRQLLYTQASKNHGLVHTEQMRKYV